MCSQFIIDMMDIASGMFTEILSCDLDLFEELFGVVGTVYQNAAVSYTHLDVYKRQVQGMVVRYNRDNTGNPLFTRFSGACPYFH